MEELTKDGNGSVKTAKVILNVIVALIVATIVDFVVALLFGMLLQLPFLYKLLQWFAYNPNPYWVVAFFSAMLSAAVAVWVLELMNKRTELEKILSSKIVGWLLVVLCVVFVILDLLTNGAVVPGDVGPGFIGFGFLVQYKLGLHKVQE